MDDPDGVFALTSAVTILLLSRFPKVPFALALVISFMNGGLVALTGVVRRLEKKANERFVPCEISVQVFLYKILKKQGILDKG